MPPVIEWDLERKSGTLFKWSLAVHFSTFHALLTTRVGLTRQSTILEETISEVSKAACTVLSDAQLLLNTANGAVCTRSGTTLEEANLQVTAKVLSGLAIEDIDVTRVQAGTITIAHVLVPLITCKRDVTGTV